MVGMSSMDLLWAIKMLLGTWMYPPDPWGILYGAHGTDGTCTFNGFLAQSSSLSSVLYSGSLTLFFLLSVRFGWREERFRRCYVEPIMHLFPLVVGWGTAFLGLGLQLFNPWTCWIQAYPPGCTESYKLTGLDEKTDCIRGDNASIYRWAFFYAILWAVWLFTLSAMLMIYWGIARSEKANEKYDFVRSASKTMIDVGSSTVSDIRNPSNAQSKRATPKRRHSRKNSRKFANQASLYVIFFVLTWIFTTISSSLQAFRNKVYSPIMVLVVIFSPLQGFFNAIIFLKPRYLNLREGNRNSSTVALLRLCLLGPESQIGNSTRNIMNAPKGSHKKESHNSCSDNGVGPTATDVHNNTMDKLQVIGPLDKQSTSPTDGDISQSLRFVGESPKTTADKEVETSVVTSPANTIDPTISQDITSLEDQLPNPNDTIANDDEAFDDSRYLD